MKQIFRTIVAALAFISLFRPVHADVDKAHYAFNQGQYDLAFSAFETAALNGDPQAQTRLGDMYRNGLGVTRDYVRAHAWYNVASASGNVLARTTRDDLASRMTASAIGQAQELARTIMHSLNPENSSGGGFAGTLEVSYTFGLFSGEKLERTKFETYRANATAEQMANDILKYNSIPGRSFEIRATNQVPNAAAAIEGSKRYILYNPSFMSQVAQSSSTPWEAYSIMAHEIGHHLAGHTLESGGSRPDKELEADYFCGGTLQRMGSSLEQTQAAMSRLGSPQGSATHPAKAQRIAAIRSGWNDARSLGGGPSPESPKHEQEIPQQTTIPGQQMPQVARACVTQWGVCSMMIPIPVGSQCTCFGGYGAIPGIAQ